MFSYWHMCNTVKTQYLDVETASETATTNKTK